MTKTNRIRYSLITFLFLCLAINQASAQPPAGYYATADESSPSALKASLHAIIKDHTRIPYTSSATDTWDVLELAGEDVDNTNNVIALYKNATYAKVSGGNSNYNREHSWPKSYGFPNDGSSNYPYTDMHHLFIANSSYNSSRSNKPFDICTSGCTEKPTDVNNGRGGAGQSNLTKTGIWDVWSARQGDVARGLFYMAVRYEGGTHGITGVSEPDLELTDDLALINASKTGSNEPLAYMGLLSVLIQWHKSDPVDIYEHQHNEAVANAQGNRNPFIDRPEWVACVFELVCSGGSDTTAPNAPMTLTGNGSVVGQITLDWFNNTEADLAGYSVYRSNSSGGAFTQLNTSLIAASAYTDSSVVQGTTYFYKVTASDNSGNESLFSTELSVTAATGTSNTPPVASFTSSCTDLSCNFDASASSDSDGSISSYSWSFGATGVTASNTFASAGSYTVTLTVTDNGGATNAVSQSVSVTAPPVNTVLSNGVAKTALSDATNGQLNYTMQVPAGATNLNFSITGGTGDADLYVRFGSAPTLSAYDCRPYIGGNFENCAIASAQTGTYYVMIVAYTAYSGVSLTGSYTNPAANVAPTASFTSSCTDLSCSFDGSGSSDSDGTIASYSWSFGATGSTASNTYGSAGTYAVTLTVTDNDGATGTSTQNVTVTAPPANIAPTASFTSSCTDLTCSFDGSASSDSDGSISSYSWSFGASGVTATNTYGSAGTYTVTLTVTDNNGATNAASQSVTVTAPPVNVAPTASFTSNCTDLTCSFDGSASSDSDGTIASYSWSFGSTGVSASNTYASAGTYAVTLTVTDNNGATGTSTQNVTVTAPPAGNVLSNGVAVTGLSAATGATVDYTMVVPAGATGLSFSISGGTGDADIYVRFGAAPTTSNYDCRPYATGNNETCNETAQAGTYYVMVRAYAAFSGVSLTGSYSTGGSTGQVFSSTTNVSIPDNNATGATSNIVSDRAGASNNMKITYNIIHTYIGDLKVELIDPNGTVTTLRSNTGGSANDINESKTINKGSTTATGTWGLRVIDSAGADTGYINSWSIEFL